MVRFLDSNVIHAFHDTAQGIASRCLHIDADHVVIVLKDYDNVVSIYVEAPRSYTLRRVMERMDDITVEEAHHLITKTDKYRADYYKYYTGGNYWTNPVNYDLTFNNARLGDDRCVKLVLECMKLKFGDDFKEYMKSIGKDI